MDMTFNCFILHYQKNPERLAYLYSALREMRFFEVLTRYDKEDIEHSLSEYYSLDDSEGQERMDSISDILRFNQILVGNATTKDGLGRSKNEIYAEIRQRLANGSLSRVRFTPPSINNISLHLKHFEAWRITCGRPFPYTLVLEDDVIFTEQSVPALEALLRDLPLLNFDYIDLAGGSALFPQGIFRKFTDNLYHIDPPSSRTTCAYLISKAFAEKLVANGMDVRQPIDVDLNHFFRKFNATVFWAEPTLFIHGSEHGYYRSSIAR